MPSSFLARARAGGRCVVRIVAMTRLTSLGRMFCLGRNLITLFRGVNSFQENFSASSALGRRCLSPPSRLALLHRTRHTPESIARQIRKALFFRRFSSRGDAGPAAPMRCDAPPAHTPRHRLAVESRLSFCSPPKPNFAPHKPTRAGTAQTFFAAAAPERRTRRRCRARERCDVQPSNAEASMRVALRISVEPGLLGCLRQPISMAGRSHASSAPQKSVRRRPSLKSPRTATRRRRAASPARHPHRPASRKHRTRTP